MSYEEQGQAEKNCCQSNSQLLFSSYRHVGNKVNKLNYKLKKQCFSEKIYSVPGQYEIVLENHRPGSE